MEIFKYLDEDRTSLLSDGLIRFTPPRAFNDPFEVNPLIRELGRDPTTVKALNEDYERTLQEAYEKLPREVKHLFSFETLHKDENLRKYLVSDVLSKMDQQTPYLADALQTHFADNIGILSLSEVHNNLLMWAHYANDHKGFTVGFDSLNHFFDQKRTENDQLRHLRKVSYSESRPILTFSQIKSIDELMIKGFDWAYEKEWRMTLALVDADAVLEDDSYPIHLFKIPFTAYSTIRIGAKASQETKNKIYDSLNKNTQLEHVKVYELSLDDRNYGLIEKRTK